MLKETSIRDPDPSQDLKRQTETADWCQSSSIGVTVKKLDCQLEDTGDRGGSASNDLLLVHRVDDISQSVK